jgi:trans-aconitate methyltransferase
MRSYRQAQIALALSTATEQERSWQGKVPEANDERHIPWLPFPIPEFVALTALAAAEADGPRFLEIGCGIGTKMLLAQAIFQLDVTGFDRVPEFVEQACGNGLNAVRADAATWDGYGEFDIVWFNRPLREAAEEAALETRVWEFTAPGTVVMCANLEARPPSSWYLIEDDWEARRGVWQKLPVS